MRPYDYAQELVQAIFWGTIMAVVVIIVFMVSGVDMNNIDTITATIVIMFIIGAVATWITLFRFKERNWLGLRVGRD